MGLFDSFRQKSLVDTMDEDMRRVAPVLFPHGHEQILQAGRTISGMLDSRLSPEAAGRLYASTKYLAYTSKDKSKQRVVEYIVRQGMGRIAPDDASAIYDRFIVAPSVLPQAGPTARLVEITAELARVEEQRDAIAIQLQRVRDAVSAYLGGETTDDEFFSFLSDFDSDMDRVNAKDLPEVPTREHLYLTADLAGRVLRLQNSAHVEHIDGATFAVLMLGLRSGGWLGAPHLFDGAVMKSLSGAYPISSSDAKEVAALLRRLIADQNLDSEAIAAMRPLISIASEGSFTVHA